MQQMSFWLPDDLYQELRKLAFVDNVSMSEIIRQSLVNMLAHRQGIAKNLDEIHKDLEAQASKYQD